MKVLQKSLGETQSMEVKTTSKSSHELPMESRAKVEPNSGRALSIYALSEESEIVVSA